MSNTEYEELRDKYEADRIAYQKTISDLQAKLDVAVEGLTKIIETSAICTGRLIASKTLSSIRADHFPDVRKKVEEEEV